MEDFEKRAVLIKQAAALRTMADELENAAKRCDTEMIDIVYRHTVAMDNAHLQLSYDLEEALKTRG